METLEKVLEKDENVLWEGIVSQKGKLKHLFYFLLYLFIPYVFIPIIFGFLVVFYGYIFLWGLVINFLLMIFMMILCMTNILYYSELRKLNYYVTNKKEFGVRKIGWTIIKEAYQSLSFNDINKVMITPLGRKQGKLAHIDFYSEIISQDPDMFYFAVRRGTNPIYAADEQWTPKEQKIDRFY